MYRRTKARIFKIIERPTADDFASRVFAYSIMTLITFNVIAVIVETVESVAAPLGPLLTVFEIFSVAVFSVEYVLRVWTCTTDARFAGGLRGRVRYALTPMALVDLLAILPFYLPMFISLDLRFVRSLRLFRLFRLFKLARYSASLRTLGKVLRTKKEELLITLFVLIVLLVFASSAMYYAENEAQPKNFSSIPAAMWWGVVTLTTVGYGDIYPVTPVGKFVGAMVAVLGVGLFALPTGILASGFTEEMQKHRRREKVVLCPHCGRDVNESPENSPAEA
ncbi:MAG TPA: ion transporter [Pyrinomonadaceae bacterium]|nr:ion transporter [Pyrinomonadaceae bacterium]